MKIGLEHDSLAVGVFARQSAIGFVLVISIVTQCFKEVHRHLHLQKRNVMDTFLSDKPWTNTSHYSLGHVNKRKPNILRGGALKLY